MPRTERDLAQIALQQLVNATTPQAFRETMPVFQEKYGDDVDLVGAAYGAFLGEYFLSSAGLFAVLTLPPDQAVATLEEIERTVGEIDYPQAPRGLKKQDRPYYQAFARFAQGMFPSFATAMRAVLTRYVTVEDDPAAEPDALVETALDEAEQDLARARERIATAGALMLAGKEYWPRWDREARGPAGAWLQLVMHVVDVLERAGVQGLPDEARRQWDATAERGASEETAADEEVEDPVAKEIATQLLVVEDQTLPDELFETCQAHRDPAISILRGIVEDEDLWREDAPGKGWGPVNAVELLGELQAEEAIPLLIDLVADYDVDDLIRDRALMALDDMGPAVRDPLLRFMRYSRANEARADLASVLAQVSPGDEQVYQTLLALLPQISWDEGRGLAYTALGETGDVRAIPLLQEALQDPGLPPIDGRDIVEVLRELGGAVPAGCEEYEEDELILDLDKPLSIQDLIASIPPELTADPAAAAHMVAHVLTTSSYPVLLGAALSPVEEDNPPALAAFFAGMRGLRFDNIASSSEEEQAILGHLADCAGPQMLRVFDGLEAILNEYAAGRYDLAADPNEQIVQVRGMLGQDSQAALRLVGQAGAAVLRGESFWPRWPEETPEPLADWLWGLRSFVHYLRSVQRYPLADVTAERQRAPEPTVLPAAAEPELPGEVQALLQGLVTLPVDTVRPAPEALAGFERWREAAIPELMALVRDSSFYENEDTWWAVVLAVRLLGHLRADRAAPLLVDIVAEMEWGDDMQAAAQRALVAIGRPAYPAIVAYFCYGQNVETKVALAEALARTGEKDAATFPLLALLWEDADWQQQRRLVAVALADLGDHQAVPLLQGALDDPRSDFPDQVHVRWALESLGRKVDLFPSSRLFYGLLDRRARISTPVHWPPLLDLDAENGTARRARYTIWGEPLCHHCGLPMVWTGEEGWQHPVAEKPAPRPAGQAGAGADKKKRKRKRK
jgi:HEAT repeat protein